MNKKGALIQMELYFDVEERAQNQSFMYCK